MSATLAPVGKIRTGAKVTRAVEEYPLGSSVSWLAEFRDPVSDALVAAADVEFRFRPPLDGVEVAEAGVLVSTGVYRVTKRLDVAGDWAVRVTATGTRADEVVFTITAGVFDAAADDPTVLVTDDGEFISLDDGSLLGG